MEKQNKNFLKWFWPWQDQQREEWLQRMSQNGWHLNSIGLGGLVFKFTPGEKLDYVYQLDFRQERSEQMVEYLDLYEKAGWEHVMSWNGWQYFRKRYKEGETAQIFTDNQSKVQKYKRLMFYSSLFFPGYMVVFMANLEKYPPWFATILVGTFIILGMYVGISILMVALRIRQLNQER